MSNLLEEHKETAENPEWEKYDNHFGKHVHDWRTYVSDEVRKIWNELPLIAKCAVISVCEEMADNEQWD